MLFVYYCMVLLLLIVQESKWEIRSPMSTRRSALSIAVLGESIYVVGGYDGNSSLCTVEV